MSTRQFEGRVTQARVSNLGEGRGDRALVSVGLGSIFDENKDSGTIYQYAQSSPLGWSWLWTRGEWTEFYRIDSSEGPGLAINDFSLMDAGRGGDQRIVLVATGSGYPPSRLEVLSSEAVRLTSCDEKELVLAGVLASEVGGKPAFGSWRKSVVVAWGGQIPERSSRVHGLASSGPPEPSSYESSYPVIALYTAPEFKKSGDTCQLNKWWVIRIKTWGERISDVSVSDSDGNKLADSIEFQHLREVWYRLQLVDPKDGFFMFHFPRLILLRAEPFYVPGISQEICFEIIEGKPVFANGRKKEVCLAP